MFELRSDEKKYPIRFERFEILQWEGIRKLINRVDAYLESLV